MGQYEMAFRMQTSVPELMDLSDEPKETWRCMARASSRRHCLYARRLAERGVRFIELFNADWDTHGACTTGSRAKCREVDQPMAALIKDLKQRGLLDDTLVVWAGEFGRTPMLQGSEKPEACGRDHHKDAFAIWLAGGGIKGGCPTARRTTSAITSRRIRCRCATCTPRCCILLGLDHSRVTFRYQGLDQRLTGVEESKVQHACWRNLNRRSCLVLLLVLDGTRPGFYEEQR